MRERQVPPAARRVRVPNPIGGSTSSVCGDEEMDPYRSPEKENPREVAIPLLDSLLIADVVAHPDHSPIGQVIVFLLSLASALGKKTTWLEAKMAQRHLIRIYERVGSADPWWPPS